MGKTAYIARKSVGVLICCIIFLMSFNFASFAKTLSDADVAAYDLAAKAAKAGVEYMNKGDLDNAAKSLGVALGLAEKLQDKEMIIMAKLSQGLLYLMKRDLGKACICWRDSENIYAQLTNKPADPRTTEVMNILRGKCSNR